MSYCIAQVSLLRDGGLPRDVSTNTFHFEDDSGALTDAGLAINGPGLITRLATFYQTIAPNLASIHTGAGVVKLYNHADAEPRIPRLQGTFTFSPSSTSLPGEVALCLSYQAAPEPGAVPARKRGRVYLGPLSQNLLVNTEGPSDMRPASASIDVFLNAAETMCTGANGTYRLAIFSPTTLADGGSLADAYTDAAVLWMDNEFDTIRSRGARRTSRRRVAVPGATPVVGVTDTPAAYA